MAEADRLELEVSRAFDVVMAPSLGCDDANHKRLAALIAAEPEVTKQLVEVSNEFCGEAPVRC